MQSSNETGSRPIIPSTNEFSQTTVFVTDGVTERLESFVNSFVKEFEDKLIDYYKESIGEIQKSGTTLGIVCEAPGAVVSWAGTLVGGAGLGRAAGERVEDLTRRFVGYPEHKKRADRITEVFSGVDRAALRGILVEAGVHIFRCYECQLMKVKVTAGWEVALTECARDATERIMNFIEKYHQKTEAKSFDEISVSFLTKGFMRGESKGWVGTYVPKRNVENDGREWKISSMWKKVLLVKLKGDGATDLYYKKKKRKSRTEKYGHRLLFTWESEDSSELDKMLNLEYKKDNIPTDKYDYILDPNGITKIVESIINEINKGDEDFTRKGTYEGVENAQETLRNVAQHVENMQDRVDKGFEGNRK